MSSDWLALPELDAALNALAVKSADVGLLNEAVSAICGATGREVRTEIWINSAQSRIFTARSKVGPKLVKLEEAGLCFDPEKHDGHRVDIYNCEVVDGRYVAHVQSGVDRREEKGLSFEQLAWRCCGYLFTPRQVRAARERARKAGFEGPIPLRYFSENSR